MRLLLDTHVLLWLLNDDRLDPTAGRALADPGSALYVSVVSLWEVVVKQRVGKLKADIEVIVGHMAPASKVQWLSITSDHLVALNRLPRHEQHRDPFDHLIIAQAISEGMTLLTRDRNASLYSVQILSA